LRSDGLAPSTPLYEEGPCVKWRGGCFVHCPGMAGRGGGGGGERGSRPYRPPGGGEGRLGVARGAGRRTGPPSAEASGARLAGERGGRKRPRAPRSAAIV